MTVEDPNVIDIIIAPRGGKLRLVIVDAGTTTGAQERLEKLYTKLAAYTRFVYSENFRKKYSGIKPSDVAIEVSYYQCQPTEEMKTITHVGKSGDVDNAIKVVHKINE